MARVRKSKSQGAKKSQGANTREAQSQGTQSQGANIQRRKTQVAKMYQVRIGARNVSGAITNFSKNFSGKIGGSRKITIQQFESMYSKFLVDLIVDANGADTISFDYIESIPFDDLYSRIKDVNNPTLLVAFFAHLYFNFVQNRQHRENILVGMITQENIKSFLEQCKTETNKQELMLIINSIVEWLYKRSQTKSMLLQESKGLAFQELLQRVS
jgi:hypothetical protein